MKNRVSRCIFFITLILIFSISITFAQTGKVQNTDYLNLREAPSTASNILTKIPGDGTFEIISDNGDWYQIKYQTYTGYVSKQYVQIEQNNINTEIKPKANAKGIINKLCDIYVLPLLNSTKIGNIAQNSEILVISINGSWAYVQSDNISGWIFKNNVNGLEEKNGIEQNENNNQGTNQEEQGNNVENARPEESNSQDENSNYPKTMYVNVEAVYIRERPTTESNAVASVGLNTPVTVNGEEGDWYKVHVTDGSGYMMKKYLSEQKK